VLALTHFRQSGRKERHSARLSISLSLSLCVLVSHTHTYTCTHTYIHPHTHRTSMGGGTSSFPTEWTALASFYMTLSFSLSLYLSLTHTHTHGRTHIYTLTRTGRVWVLALVHSRRSGRKKRHSARLAIQNRHDHMPRRGDYPYSCLRSLLRTGVCMYVWCVYTCVCA